MPNSLASSTILPQITGDDFYSIAITFDRALTPQEKEQVLGIIGYWTRANLRSSDSIIPMSSDAHCVAACVDSTKTVSDDIFAYDDLFETLAEYLRDGTPARTTNRSGPCGSRLVEGVSAVAQKIALDQDEDEVKTPVAIGGLSKVYAPLSVAPTVPQQDRYVHVRRFLNGKLSDGDIDTLLYLVEKANS